MSDNPRKLLQMPGADRSPLTVLHQMLEMVDDLEAVCVVFQLKEGRGYSSKWSSANYGDGYVMLTYARLDLEKDMMDQSP